MCSLGITEWVENKMVQTLTRLGNETFWEKLCAQEMVSAGELSANECKLLEQISRHASTHPQKPTHS